jgi:dihydroxyacid dehydratase/phosphogluconate dehydratase
MVVFSEARMVFVVGHVTTAALTVEALALVKNGDTYYYRWQKNTINLKISDEEFA